MNVAIQIQKHSSNCRNKHLLESLYKLDSSYDAHFFRKSTGDDSLHLNKFSLRLPRSQIDGIGHEH